MLRSTSSHNLLTSRGGVRENIYCLLCFVGKYFARSLYRGLYSTQKIVTAILHSFIFKPPLLKKELDHGAF
jgi:hypothetical protein